MKHPHPCLHGQQTTTVAQSTVVLSDSNLGVFFEGGGGVGFLESPDHHQILN